MFANACSKQWKSLEEQSSIFVSSGLKPAATEPPMVELRVDSATNSATWLISVSLSFWAKEGMPTPPFRTWRTTRCASGRSSSRLGPVVPFDLAADSVWQPPQPASEKTFAPGSDLVEGAAELSFLPPPQPDRARSASVRRAAARVGNARTRHIEANASRRVE